MQFVLLCVEDLLLLFDQRSLIIRQSMVVSKNPNTDPLEIRFVLKEEKHLKLLKQ